MTGKWHRPLAELQPAIAEAAAALGDAKPGIVVFHCTASSMEAGLEGERSVLDTIMKATGCAAITTGQAITEALNFLRVRKLVLLSPYVKATNEHEVHYLREAGFEVVHELGLGLSGSDDYIAVTPERWQEIAWENRRAEADGYLLSCTNTTMIEAIEAAERRLAKPVITSNQATLWACLRRLGVPQSIPCLGRLFTNR
ncbi:MAG TPA: maleate cis-trans isomerase, partial [Candidatus Binatia bacterium]